MSSSISISGGSNKVKVRLKSINNTLISIQYYDKVWLKIWTILLIFSFSITSEALPATNTTAETDRFLKQLLGAEQRGMGGSFVGGTAGANALGNNPAGITTTKGDRFVLHMTRFPHTIVLLSKPNVNIDYEDYSKFDQRASGIETLNWAFPMGKYGTIGLAFAMAHAGPFRRVNHQGKALNNFPENNLAIGMGYGINCFGGTVLGFDARWLRSKITDTSGTEHFGHGYTYNIGLIQHIGNTLQLGIVIRNLSNGLSFVDPAIPDSIHRDVIAGLTYQRDISNITLRLGFDVHPPFPDGVRTNLGAEIWYRDRFGGRIGYLRDTESRYASVYLLEDLTYETEERTWKAEGLCLGLGLRVGNFIFNASYTPQFKPTVYEDERIHIVQGTSIYSFSIGQVF